MWVHTDRLQEIDSALHQGRRDDIDTILSQILEADTAQSAVPTTCPVCRRDLVRTTLPHVSLFVSACPNQHGVWMTPKVSERFREFVAEQVSVAARRRYRLKVLTRLLLLTASFAAGALLFMHLPTPGTRPSDFGERDSAVRNREGLDAQRAQEAREAQTAEARDAQKAKATFNARTDEGYWPGRNLRSYYPLPIKESRINHADELLYFQQVIALLEEGIANRLNMDAVLTTERSAGRYARLFELYQSRQSAFLERLRAMVVPPKLRSIHDRLIVATEQQIALYGAFVAAKTQDPTTDLGRMLTHPALQATSRELHAAYDRFKQLYPDVDRETNDAFESRLCLFDVI